MFEKNVHVIQPYHVGNRDRKSLAMILPAQLARQLGIDPSTIIIAKMDSGAIILKPLNLTEVLDKNHAGEANQTIHQQRCRGVL